MKPLLVVFFLVSASLASAAPLTCADQPGRRFCGRLNRFSSLLGSCTGSGCESLWVDQIRQIRIFLDEYYETFLPGDEVGADLGKLAQSTAKTLCKYEVTGEEQWISALTVQYNRYLKALKEIQTLALLKDAYSCTFSRK